MTGEGGPDEAAEIVLGVVVRRAAEGVCVLIARRPQETVLGGYWELPGGKVREEETHRRALRREIGEELAIDVEVGEAVAFIEHRYDHGTVRLHAYWCTPVDETEPTDLETAEHRWVTPAELRGYRFPPANQALTERIIAALS